MVDVGLLALYSRNPVEFCEMHLSSNWWWRKHFGTSHFFCGWNILSFYCHLFTLIFSYYTSIFTNLKEWWFISKELLLIDFYAKFLYCFWKWVCIGNPLPSRLNSKFFLFRVKLSTCWNWSAFYACFGSRVEWASTSNTQPRCFFSWCFRSPCCPIGWLASGMWLATRNFNSVKGLAGYIVWVIEAFPILFLFTRYRSISTKRILKLFIQIFVILLLSLCVFYLLCFFMVTTSSTVFCFTYIYSKLLLKIIAGKTKLQENYQLETNIPLNRYNVVNQNLNQIKLTKLN